MRWAVRLLRLLAPSRPARRTFHLTVRPLEDRAVPSTSGVLIDLTDPTPADVPVVTSEVPTAEKPDVPTEEPKPDGEVVETVPDAVKRGDGIPTDEVIYLT